MRTACAGGSAGPDAPTLKRRSSGGSKTPHAASKANIHEERRRSRSKLPVATSNSFPQCNRDPLKPAHVPDSHVSLPPGRAAVTCSCSRSTSPSSTCTALPWLDRSAKHHIVGRHRVGSPASGNDPRSPTQSIDSRRRVIRGFLDS